MSTPALGRIAHFDDRSREYGIRPLLARRPVPRRRTVWALPDNFPLNQGEEGACVGFGWSAELASEPIMYATTTEYAFKYYRWAQAEDRRMGNHFSEGASVLAGARVARGIGMVGTYRWAFGLDDVIDTLVQKGPVVLGVNWYEGMYSTDDDGGVEISGRLVGGHCITAIGYEPEHPKFGPCVRWVNSWGPDYGVNGIGFIRVEDLGRLLREDGEACIATDILLR